MCCTGRRERTKTAAFRRHRDVNTLNRGNVDFTLGCNAWLQCLVAMSTGPKKSMSILAGVAYASWLYQPPEPERLHSSPRSATGNTIPSSVQFRSGRVPSTRLVLTRLQTLHVVHAQLEIEDLGVFLNPGVRNALRQDHEPFLQAPAKQNLRSSLVVFGCKRLEEWVVATCGTDKRRVSFEDNIAL
jgi:hypothetical protein